MGLFLVLSTVLWAWGYRAHFTINEGAIDLDMTDEEIEVELTPVMSRLSDDEYTGKIEMLELHTKVIAKNGQGIVIGSSDSQENSVANIFYLPDYLDATSLF